MEERQRPPLSPDFNRYERYNQEIWRQQRPEIQTSRSYVQPLAAQRPEIGVT
ncbi:hypothetical protein [Paenibacillus borealis]|uniref:hypothetical protein n=1 Tax=Paenibacillus borealis TaxID=160799 RepID=UPI000A960867|nr:hypothetical protein [Paenibacillus borealis]